MTSTAAVVPEVFERITFKEDDTLLDAPTPPTARVTSRDDTLVDPPDDVVVPEEDTTLREAPEAEPRLTRETAGLVGEYRFRRLQGHQAGCQCQSRGDHLGCRELRSQLLAAGLWGILYDESPERGPNGRRTTP